MYSHSFVFRCCESLSFIKYKLIYDGITKIFNSDNRYILNHYIEIRYYVSQKPEPNYKEYIIHCHRCSNDKKIKELFPNGLINIQDFL